MRVIRWKIRRWVCYNVRAGGQAKLVCIKRVIKTMQNNYLGVFNYSTYSVITTYFNFIIVFFYYHSFRWQSNVNIKSEVWVWRLQISHCDSSQRLVKPPAQQFNHQHLSVFKLDVMSKGAVLTMKPKKTSHSYCWMSCFILHFTVKVSLCSQTK